MSTTSPLFVRLRPPPTSPRYCCVLSEWGPRLMDMTSTAHVAGCPPTGVRLPVVVVNAADRLGAPRQDWHSTDDLVGWVTTSLGFTMPCSPIDALRSRSAGAVRHWVLADPRTEETVVAPDPTQSPKRQASTQEKVDAKHMLWALTHTRDDGPPCEQAGWALATWVGTVHPGSMAPWAPSSNDRMRAVRTMLRTVQYVDAGLDLQANEGWLAIGVHSHVLSWVRDLLNSVDPPIDEAGLLRYLERQVGMRGTLKVGQKAVADSAWLCAVVQDWCHRITRLHLPDLPPPTR